MGYETNYNLEVFPEFTPEMKLMIEDDEELIYALGEDSYSCKWYNHEKDMRAFSKNFPDSVFHLYGEGEESGDIWIKYFKDGKMQVAEAQIIYDEYDEKKLN